MSKKLPPKIVFLDAGTVDLGDIQLSALKKLGNLVLYNDTRPEDIHTRAYGASVVITNKCVFTQAIFEKLPDLQLICVAATGVNNIDLEIAKNKGVMVANAANYSTATVVEHTLLFILGFAHRLVEHHQSVIDRRWSNGRQFAIFDYPYSEVSGKTLGVIGYGNIGKKVAAAAKALGMKVLIAKLPNRKYSASPARLPLEQVLKQSDFVTLHCTLTEDTRHLMNTKRLNIMKRSGVLINLARGPIVNEWAVAEVLQTNRLAGYATDVMEEEPPPSDHPFFQEGVRHKVLMTPHIAWASREARQRLIEEIALNIDAFLKGKKRNRVV